MNDQPRLDREIIRLIDQVHESGFSSLDIKTGSVVMNGIRVDFGERSLLEDKIQLILPTDFRSIPPETIYRPQAKPDLLLADAGGAIQITMTYTRKRVGNDEDVKAYQDEVRNILQTLNSALEWREGGVIKAAGGGRVTYFEFITPMLGSRIYNLSFFLKLQQRALTGSFVCPEPKLKAWKGVFHQMLASIKVTETAIREVEGIETKSPPPKGFEISPTCSQRN
jgi:hypothetical protein